MGLGGSPVTEYDKFYLTLDSSINTRKSPPPLRESKRHTVRHVASPWGTSSCLSWLGRGSRYLGWGVRYLGLPTPPPDLARGGRYLGWGVGTLGYPLPPSWPAQGCRYLGQEGRYLGVPPIPTWPEGVGTLGYPSSWPGWGIGTLDLARVGTPPPPVDKLSNSNYYLPPSYGCGQ